MNAYLHLDDDVASYLNEQARQEHTTLEAVLNRVVRRSVQTRLAVPSAGGSWLDEVRALRAKCSTGKPGTPVEDLITQTRS
jgi:hypothetical protein